MTPIRAQIRPTIIDALKSFKEEVSNESFPASEHSFNMPDETLIMGFVHPPAYARRHIFGVAVPIDAVVIVDVDVVELAGRVASEQLPQCDAP